MRPASPAPLLVTWALGAAWLDWVLAAGLTLATTERPVMLGVALPTLATQALLIVGIGLGSNVARMSFYIWSIFGAILGASGGESVPDGAAALVTLASHGLTVATLAGLLLPPANRWFLAQRTLNRAAGTAAIRMRARRNLVIGTAWLLVLPASLLIALPLHTPLRAVLMACVVACCVGLGITVRQVLKLYLLRGAV